MAKITWTAEAQHWLQEIYDYIALDNTDAAYRTVTAIHERAEVLLMFPQMGTQYRTDPHIRILVEGNYRIAYLLRPDVTSISWESSTARFQSNDTCLDEGRDFRALPYNPPAFPT